jgi:hypothetical protein
MLANQGSVGPVLIPKTFKRAMKLEMRRPRVLEGISTQCVSQTILFRNYASVGSILFEMIRLLPRSTKVVHHIAVSSGFRSA